MPLRRARNRGHPPALQESTDMLCTLVIHDDELKRCPKPSSPLHRPGYLVAYPAWNLYQRLGRVEYAALAMLAGAFSCRSLVSRY